LGSKKSADESGTHRPVLKAGTRRYLVSNYRGQHSPLPIRKGSWAGI